MALFGHDADWWEAKAGKELAEGGLSPSTWSRWAKAESRELDREIGTGPGRLDPFAAVSRGADLEAGS
jgi:hypothetical protein